MSQPVFYHSGMAGFPSGTVRVAGGVIAVLDACLVNGANNATAVTLEQTAGVATMAFAGNHNFNVGDRVLVDGATPSGYNGLKTVTAKTANSISYAVDSALAGTATGTITVKHPGAGWEKTWSDTNAAAYRSATSGGGVGAYMQIEDNNPYNNSFGWFRWRVCEGHTGLDTATRLVTAPRAFFKPQYGTQAWWCVATDRMAYLCLLNTTDNTNTLFSFGELSSFADNDTGAWVFPANETQGEYAVGGCGVSLGTRSDRPRNEYAYQVLKTWSGISATALISPTIVGGLNDCIDASLRVGDVQRSGTVPNPLTGNIELVPVRALEQVYQGLSTGAVLSRGMFPGVYHPVGQMPAAMFNSMRVGVVDNLLVNGAPRKVMFALIGHNAGGVVAFDLTGPWE